MNYGVILYILGWILKAEAGFMLLPCVISLIFREKAGLSYLITAVVCLLVGILLSRKKPQKGGLYLKEGFFVVALGWILMSLFGAVPFYISGEIPHYMDAIFESVSGLSTTGASILSDVEGLSRTTVFWRSFLHLLGGMGVFVFLSALLPMLGGNTVNLMKAESTGPSVDKLVPRLRDTAKILYAIYLSLGLIEVIILLVLKLDWFSAITLTFGTIGTGGFAILNSSIGGYSSAVQWVIGIFMLLSGVNYSMYFLLLRRRFKAAFGLEEVRVYFILTVAAIATITFNIRGIYSTFGDSVRHAFFQVASLVTSTGYSTVNYEVWPEFSKTVLILIMLIGACAGSTGGGLKVSRVILAVKAIGRQVQMLIHPRAVKKIKMDGNAVETEIVRSNNAYIAVFFIIMSLSVLLVSIDGYDFTTNFTAVLATINNMGPGFNLVGPACNFGFFSDFSKLILIFDMLAGRLELLPMLLIINPKSWSRHL